LASYRLGEVYSQQINYQAAEDAFRAALSGDGVPKWIEVWSELQLGRIFDASGQRDRAINEYREAIETHDDTSGAVTLASDYLKLPYAPAAGATH
jgi:tetratricopeptide (TPR) repeat protein